MSKIINASLDVYLKPVTVTFWRSVYGIEPSYCEDLFLYFQKKEERQSLFFQIYTNGNFQTLARATDELTTRMLKEECQSFGLPLEAILGLKKMKMSLDQNSAYNPASQLTFDVARESTRYFCQMNNISPFAKVHFMGKPKRSSIRQDFRQDQRNDELRQGKPHRIILTPQFLKDYQGLPGTSSLTLKNFDEIEYAYLDAGHYYARFKDGSEKLISRPVIKEIT